MENEDQIEKTTNDLKPELNEEQSGEAENPKLCIACKQEILHGATKCYFCHSNQGWERHISGFVPALSLVVAIIAITPNVLNQIEKSLRRDGPNYEVLTFFADMPVNSDGTPKLKPEFQIGAQIRSLDTDTLIVDDSLHCEFRNGIERIDHAAEITRSQTNTSKPIIVSNDWYWPYLYLENEVKSLIHAEQTVSVIWGISPNSSLEYENESNSSKYQTGQELSFYSDVLNDLQRIVPKTAADLEENDDHFLELDDQGKIISLSLHFDCRFSIGDTFGTKEHELHLEIFYEVSGSEGGDYPRWTLGKNIGGGAGNGAGAN